MSDQHSHDPSLHSDSASTARATERSKETAGRPKRSFRVGSCLLKLFLLSVIVGAVLFFVQQNLTPDVDPELEQEMQIVHAEVDSDDARLVGGNDALNSDATAEGNSANKGGVDDSSKLLTDTISMEMVAAAEHPLEPLLELAQLGVDYIDENVKDYSATIVSRVRIGRRLGSERAMAVKIRHERNATTKEKESKGTFEPFSVYTKFLKPKNLVGREAIWVKDENEGLILAHLTGLLNFDTFHVDPLSSQAMSGSRHPIFKIGFKNLIIQMIDYGKNDMKYQECQVKIERNVVVDGHKCTMLKIIHPKYRDHFEFHIAKIYLDDERQIPIGYEGFLWPEKEGEEPPLLERYFYRDIKLNIGLTDEDFDPENKAYEYPNW